jgi:3D (Asp-Asp-Asp) domain-containing protein
MWNTYYYFANENDYSGADDTTLYDSSCNPIAEVPADFSDSVCIEGSGILEEGVVINYSSKCACGRPCPTGGTVCYMELDPGKFPWGMGSKSNPLEPLVSFAVDTDFIPFGTTLYVEEFDGVFISAVDGIGGFKHDGCFRADDVGGGIEDNHFDFFSGTSNMWKSLENIFETGSTFHVYKNGERCSYLE